MNPHAQNISLGFPGFPGDPGDREIRDKLDLVKKEIASLEAVQPLHADAAERLERLKSQHAELTSDRVAHAFEHAEKRRNAEMQGAGAAARERRLANLRQLAGVIAGAYASRGGSIHADAVVKTALDIEHALQAAVP